MTNKPANISGRKAAIGDFQDNNEENNEGEKPTERRDTTKVGGR